MFRNLIPIVVSILLLSAVGVAKAADVRSFDVMGMKLGMSVAEIEAAAVASGLVEKGRMKAPSFEQAVALRWKQVVDPKNYRGLRKLEFESGAQHVEVDFVATPDGSKAYMVHYIITDPDLSPDKLSEELEERYGPPDKQTARAWTWGDVAALPLRTDPNLEYRIAPTTTLVGRTAVGALTLRDPQLSKQSRARIEEAAS